MGVGKILSRGGGTGRFFQTFFWRGARSGEIYFLPLETKKTDFCWNFKLLPPFRHPCVCVEKSSCHTIKNGCYFKRFNTILNSEILLNLMRKMKYLTDQFQLCFCFCVGNAKQLYLFLHWQHNWHPCNRQIASGCICFHQH